MQTNGFIKLHRSVLDWEWYADRNTFRLFLHILLRVNYRDALWKNGLVIRRGSMLTSVRSLSQETGLSVQQTRSAIRNLLDSKQITIQTTNKYTVITVVGYDLYQGAEDRGNTQSGKQNNKQSGKQITHDPTTREEIEEEKEIKKTRRTYLLSAEADARAHERVNYAQIVDSFNRICTSLPQVQTLNDARKQAIKAACPSVDAFGGWDKLFGTVQQSDFLTGRSGSWNGCGFDWILKRANLVKIIEGNYTDTPKQKERVSFGSHINTGAHY